MTKKQPENGVEAPDSTEPIGELSAEETQFIALWRGDDFSAFMTEYVALGSVYMTAHQEAADQARAEMNAEYEQRAAAEREAKRAAARAWVKPPPPEWAQWTEDDFVAAESEDALPWQEAMALYVIGKLAINHHFTRSMLADDGVRGWLDDIRDGIQESISAYEFEITPSEWRSERASAAQEDAEQDAAE